MVSRRRILSQSRDELSFRARQETEEDDTWYNKDKLYKVRTSSRHVSSVVAVALR